MSKVSQVKNNVQSILSQSFGSINVDSDGIINIFHKSTLVSVSVEEFGNKADDTVIDVRGVISFNTKLSSDLLRWLNEKNSICKFGKIYHLDSGKNTGIVFEYNLLGNYLDKEELLNAVAAVALISDELDDEAINLFGGKRFID